ncbi:MAG: hypothetical protein KGH64_05245 [Candidatus Micrarchaeota archaeon]|nr:hypothetical protein [Candidatus Micrarchaeota archaeon]MDE1834714.1 hypothetical protein [Candidatus Micrarchaeota archaeon]MDE1859017.1 hypothetical protein [Candidatus Micrarchaeota archaeon]
MVTTSKRPQAASRSVGSAATILAIGRSATVPDASARKATIQIPAQEGIKIDAPSNWKVYLE